MNKERYADVVEDLTRDRKKVSKGKREDYTKGSDNVLQNFYNQAESFGMTPYQSLGVHMEKQISAVFNYIKTDGQSESEPIIKRIGDSINYLELLWGLINDKDYEDPSIETARKVSNDQFYDRLTAIYADKANKQYYESKYGKDIDEVNISAGDICQIVSNTSYHKYDIGDKVELLTFKEPPSEFSQGFWSCRRLDDGVEYEVYEQDLKLYEQ